MKHKFSIITPAHKNTPYHKELYDSILAQTYKNWEWILWLNNDIKRDLLPEEFEKDERVIIYETNNTSKNVGYHKHHAFHKGTGDVLVEVDSDDLIDPKCLQLLNKAYQDPEVGFAYSDSAIWDDDFVPYNADHGWTHYPYKFRDKILTTMRTWEPTSHSLGFIWYAPDHVRSWRKDIYHQIGGHKEDLSICDDQELMIRTYMDSESNHDLHCMEQNHHPISQSHYMQNQLLDLCMPHSKVEGTLDQSGHQNQPPLKHHLSLYERHDAYGILHSLMYYLSHIL